MKKLLVIALALCVALGMTGIAVAQGSGGKAKSEKEAGPPLKDLTGTVKAEKGKVTFVEDKTNKSWDIMNPEAVKGHEGHHVILNAHVYADKGTIHVMGVKMVKAEGKGEAKPK